MLTDKASPDAKKKKKSKKKHNTMTTWVKAGSKDMKTS